MRSFNLSEWALNHKQMVAFLMVALTVAGIWSFMSLGQNEDPSFTFKVAVVRTAWPGATATQVEQEVTERVEKKLQEVPYVDTLRSYSKPGESLVFVLLKDSTPPAAVPESWRKLRQKVDDVKPSMPQGVQGPFVNDEFGDTFGNIVALTGDGFSLPELRRIADRVALELRRVPDVKKVDLLGVQSERIYIEVSHAKLSTLGLSPAIVFDALQKQNTLTPAGDITTPTDRVRVRVSGAFDSVESIREIGIWANGRQFRLGDIAEVSRGLADPPDPLFRWNGQSAVGIAVAMTQGGDVIRLGRNLRAAMREIEAELPRGVDIHTVSDQPAVVQSSIEEFTHALAEAVIIVLAVSFFSLGWRTGMVVALSIPLVLAITFTVMQVAGIDLQRISLGALIIALGLLVDDAIISVEMMVVKMEHGWDRFRAAIFAYTSTAFPMLTGTLVTAAGFMPVGFAKSAAGEYTFSIFAVVTIALLVSWIVAVVFTPFIGYYLLPADKLARHGKGDAETAGHDLYNTRFYRMFRRTLVWCVTHRWITIAATVAAFALSCVVMAVGVQKQFFPSSNRPELVVDLWLPQGASLDATTAQAKRLEALLAKDDDVSHFVSYIGSGSPRFYLPLDQQMAADNLAEFVITTRDADARERVKTRLEEIFPTQFPSVRGRVLRLENGPPVGFPIQYRVIGDDLQKIRQIANQVADAMRASAHTADVNFDWNELSKTVRLEVDQDRARALGVSTQEISQYLQTILRGVTITQMREGDQLIDIVGRAVESDRNALEQIGDINVHTHDGRYVPLSQLAKISYGLEEGVIWRRDRLPTITVRADVRGDVQAPDVSAQLRPAIDRIRAGLPLGYRIEEGGATEESAKGETSIIAVMPIMLIVVLVLLMMQLQNFSHMLMVVLSAPLGLIGVALILFVGAVPFGFVANLGVIALFGMIMRNAVILIDQIQQDLRAGHTPWESIIGSAVRRFRPIMLTALTAILAMIPLSRSVFWGPMAVAIMGGLLVATVLTLLFLPALYAAWYRVPVPAQPGPVTDLAGQSR
ncbi:efflux RND transporter permease subunit [Uliginosibacterium sp. sgz301328]|uniref:efflux RND transporter permease subunit n=1 Tax=Uliginosibacterium sp. sgz301328 TaxID=3243764 RepID=UPI00359D12AA